MSVAFEILGPLCGPSRHKAAPTGDRVSPGYAVLVGAALRRDGLRSSPGNLNYEVQVPAPVQIQHIEIAHRQ